MATSCKPHANLMQTLCNLMPTSGKVVPPQCQPCATLCYLMPTSCQPHANLVPTSCKPRATSCKPRAKCHLGPTLGNLMPTSCKPWASSCQPHANLMQSLCLQTLVTIGCLATSAKVRDNWPPLQSSGKVHIWASSCIKLGKVANLMQTSNGANLVFVLGYHWLPLATIDLVGDNREFEV